MTSESKRTIRVVAGLIRDSQGRALITQRRPQAFMPLKWEFPGGKVEAGESDQEALNRELKEELDIDVQVCEHFMGLIHSYPDFDVDFQVYNCKIVSGKPGKIAVNDFKWIHISELCNYEFPPADQPTISKLLD
ncbi:MAG TPA: 8-oxo-dGTP diphosphatase MutT [Myxococcota bacterium]|nr:8-oxo-dGTP diphosphatase MutT [Myxococcota bacterium]